MIFVGQGDTSAVSEPTSINDINSIAGTFQVGGGGVVGFLRKLHQEPQFFEVKHNGYTSVTGMNESNTITGWFIDSATQAYRSFVRQEDGTIALIDCLSSSGTYAKAINSNGIVAGYCYLGGSESAVGFIYNP